MVPVVAVHVPKGASMTHKHTGWGKDKLFDCPGCQAEYNERQAEQARAITHRFIGCQWGQGITTAEDQVECPEMAAQYVCFHDGPREYTFRLCEHHREVAMAVTTPHQEES